MQEHKSELFEKQDWPYIIKDLTLYAHSRFQFWNLLSEKGVKGYSPEEIAYQAIELVLAEDWHWDPNKSELLPYLKFHVVKGLVANLARNDEVKKSDWADINELNKRIDYDEEAIFNAKQIIEFVKKGLENEPLLFEIFNGLYDGLKRQEICDQLNIKPEEYDNQIRRLKTRLLRFEKTEIFNSLK